MFNRIPFINTASQNRMPFAIFVIMYKMVRDSVSKDLRLLFFQKQAVGMPISRSLSLGEILW